MQISSKQGKQSRANEIQDREIEIAKRTIKWGD